MNIGNETKAPQSYQEMYDDLAWKLEIYAAIMEDAAQKAHASLNAMNGADLSNQKSVYDAVMTTRENMDAVVKLLGCDGNAAQAMSNTANFLGLAFLGRGGNIA